MSEHQLACVPEEILIDHFLPFVHHKALIALKTTNQYFNKLIWDYWIKYKTSYSIPYGIGCGRIENIYKYFVSKLSNLTEISAEKSLDDDGHCQLLDDFSLFKMLQSLSGKLKKLDLSKYDTLCGNFIQDISEKKIPALYTIEEMLVRDVDFELQNVTMQSFVRMKKLIMIGKEALDVDIDTFKFPPSLETLILDYELPDTFLATIGEQCPNLTDLRVKGVSDEVALDLVQSLPKLTSFHLILDETCTNLSNKFFSIFKKKNISLNISSISLPYSIDAKSTVNPFGIYSDKLTYLGLYCSGEHINDIFLNSIVCLKNLKKLKLVFENAEEIKFSPKLLHSLSNNSTLKHLERLTCILNTGAGSLIPIIVDSAIREINLQGEEEEYFDFSFLKRCTNIETLNLDFESNNNNLLATLSSGIHLPNLRTVYGKLFTSNVVKLLPNKENIKSLKMVYDTGINLTEFNSLKILELFMSECFPNNIVLPISVNNLEILSQTVEPRPEFISNILSLKNLRILKLKMECLNNDAVTAICKKDSPIEELLIGGSKFLTNSITQLFTLMENLRNLMIIDCREFKDCNEISLLEYERNFHLFSSRIKERKFDFEKAYSTVHEEFKTRIMQELSKNSIDAIFQELHTTHLSKLLKERKLIELNFCTCSLLTLLRDSRQRLEYDNELWLLYYLLLSTFSEFTPIHQPDLLKFVNSVYDRLNERRLNEEQTARLHYCCAKSINQFILVEHGIVLTLVSVLLDMNDLKTISKITSSLPQSLFMVNPQMIKTVTKFMETCDREKDHLLQHFSFPNLFPILSVLVYSREITSIPLFSDFCYAITSAYCFNIDCPAIMKRYFEAFNLIQQDYNPFGNLCAKLKKEKEDFRKIDPLDESIPIRDKVALAVSPEWADEKTYVDFIEISHSSNVELFLKIKSHTFKAFGFTWYLTIQNGEYLEEVSTSLHLESVHSSNPEDANLIVDYLKVKVLFMNFTFDPSDCFVKTHKFKFKDDFVSDNTYYNKSNYSKTLEEFKYRTVICFKLLEKRMKPIMNEIIPNNPLNYLSNKHPWLAKQIAKERPIHHETVTVLTPVETLVDDCFSSNVIKAFDNDILFYIKPKSRKSGLFAIDLTDQFIPTNLYKVKYLFANESFDPDSVQIGKYEKKDEQELDETPYVDSEKDFNLFEPIFYQPQVIEREPGKFFNKYVFQLVLVLGNTANGLNVGHPYDEMDDDDDWEDM